uniref:Uncharacterized protein n=1 Tax=Ditylenchus dipsaci TaxID=166011 RepID=A0A915EH09_9BILA
MGLFSCLSLCFPSLRILALAVLLLSIAQLMAVSSAALSSSNEFTGAISPEISGSAMSSEWPSSLNSNINHQNYNTNYLPLMIRATRARIERRDRPCLINAGLSQGCDLSDILYAKYQANKFSSFAGPGR